LRHHEKNRKQHCPKSRTLVASGHAAKAHVRDGRHDTVTAAAESASAEGGSQSASLAEQVGESALRGPAVVSRQKENRALRWS